MASEDNTIAPNATGPDRIDVNSDEALDLWSKRFDVTSSQLKEAVGAVGDKAADIEMHLKGSRSVTNSDRVEEAGGMEGTGTSS
jgi:hypothetical protein